MRRSGMVLGGVLVLLLPLAVIPYGRWFHQPFVASKALAVVIFGGSAYLLLGLSCRRDGDPLARWRQALGLFVPILLTVSALKSDGLPFHLLPWLAMAMFPLVFMEVGAAFGRDPIRRRLLTVLVAVSAIPVLAVGLLRRHAGWFDGIPDRTDVALASTIGNSNELAEWAAPLAVLTLFLAVDRRRAAGWLWALPACALVALSNSRGGMLALLAGIATFAVLWWSITRGMRGLQRTVAVATICVAAVASAVALVPQASPIRERAATVLDPTHDTNAVRLGLWAATLDCWMDAPALGVGVGRIEGVFPIHRRPDEWELSRFESLIESPHQEPLWILAEGGLLGLAFILVASGLVIRSLSRALRSNQRDIQVLACAGAGALMASLVTACVRSPLHHPCGVLIPSLVIGVVAAASGPLAPRARFTAATCHALVAISLVGVIPFLIQDHLVANARWSKVDAERARRDNNPVLFQTELEKATRALDRLESFGPWNVHHAYRAALVAEDLAQIRFRLTRPDMQRQLELQGFDDPSSWLPSFTSVERFLDRTLVEMPWHHEARILLARVLEQQAINRRSEPAGSEESDVLVDRAVHILTEYLNAVPQARRLREVLADMEMGRGRVGPARRWLKQEAGLHSTPPEALQLTYGKTALQLGCDPETFGTWLDRTTRTGLPDASDPKELQRARHAIGAGDHAAARHQALLHLAEVPTNAEALRIVSEAAFQTRDPTPEIRIQGDQAVARLKLLLAFEAEGEEDLRMLRVNLRLARKKDPGLLDAVFLGARLAARDNDRESLITALRTLLDAGISKEELIKRCLDDGGWFQPHLAVIRDL